VSANPERLGRRIFRLVWCDVALLGLLFVAVGIWQRNWILTGFAIAEVVMAVQIAWFAPTL
jgi:hypothetical protein